MNYSLQQLRILVEVAEKGSITAAAEALHLTQPAVSIQLKNLQAQFQLPLYEVISRRLYITDFGREIAQLAREILAMSEQIGQKQALFMGLLAGSLRLSVVLTAQYLIPYLIKDFSQKHPQVQIELWVKDKQQVIDDLLHHRIDLALITLPPEKLRLSAYPFMKNYLIPVIGRQSRWRGMPFEEIVRKAPALLRERGSGTRQISEQYFRQQGISLQRYMEFNSSDTIKQAILADMGWAILPLISLHNELLLGQIELIENPAFPLETDWQFVWLTEKKLSPLAAAFLDYVRSIQVSFLEEHFSWMSTFMKSTPPNHNTKAGQS